VSEKVHFKTVDDALKRLVRMQDAQGQTLQMDYDRSGNLVQLMDAKGYLTRWAYDKSDRPLKKLYHDGASEAFGYSQGLLAQSTSALGAVTSYSYDQNANLKLIDYPNMADVSLTYNALDDVTSLTDGVGTHGFSYSQTGRLLGQDGPFVNDNQSYGYDGPGRLISQSVERGASGGTQSQSYTFDALERLATLTSGGTQGVGSFTYNYVGNTSMLSRLDLPNQTQTVQSYDGLNRLSQTVNQKSGGALLNKFAYAYDTRDVRTGVQSQHGTDPLRQISYGYDTVDQLKTESATGGAANTNYSNAFSYDGMGNRTRVENVSGGNTRVTNSTPNELNQLSALSQSVSGAPATTSGFGYDLAGNTTLIESADGGKMLFTYDDADRLVRVERQSAAGVPLGKSEFLYDYASRKAVSREFTWTNGAYLKTEEKRRVFDGLDVVQERNAANEVTAQLVRDGNIGGILARSTAAGKTFFGYDGGGNVTLLTDENGNDVGRYRYDAFGDTLEASGARAAENPYRFSTKELHPQSGLYDYGYRFYSPGLGRWINRDPLSEGGGANMYGFGPNSPVNGFDEYGMDWVDNTNNFVTGMGDNLSFGATGQIRQWMGTDVTVNRCSGWYSGGQWAGTGVSLAMGGAGAVNALKGAKAAAAGSNILANTYRLSSPAARAGVKAFNRVAYKEFKQVGGRIVLNRSQQLLINGKRVNGYYDQTNKLIVLGRGSNLGTLTEELIHSRQAIEAGGRVANNMKNLAEIQAHKQLLRLGFYYR